jgi:acyl-coenzyme A synthetase/AMP-(fatty) acid ligase
VDAIPGVRRSAAIGVTPASDVLSEEVVVVIEVDRGMDDAARLALRNAVTRAVRDATGVLPFEVALVAANSIPLTPSGKTRYGILKASWTASPAR